MKKVNIIYKKITDNCFKIALKIVEENKEILFHISDILIEKESITNEELDVIFKEYEFKLNYAT